jgi:hypothetical protein
MVRDLKAIAPMHFSGWRMKNRVGMTPLLYAFA